MLLTFVPYSLRRSVGGAHTDSSKPGLQPAFRAAAPTHSSPLGTSQHVLRRYRQNVWHMPLAGLAPNFGHRPNQLHANGVHLEMTRDANGPSEIASCEPLAEWCAHSVTRVRQYTAEADTGCNHAIDLAERDLRLRPCGSMFDRNAGPLQTYPIAGPTLGQEKA